MQEPDAWISGNQVANVRAVGEDQQFPIGIDLLQEARYCLRQPFPAVARQAQARHETGAARSPRELPFRLREPLSARASLRTESWAVRRGARLRAGSNPWRRHRRLRTPR